MDAALAGQFRRIPGFDGVHDERVVDGYQVASRAVERVGKATRLARHGPLLGTDGLRRIVGKIEIAALIEHLAVGNVALKQGPLSADEVEHLARGGNLFRLDDRFIVNQAEAGLAVQRDYPEPAALAGEVIGRQKEGVVALLIAAAVQPDLRRGAIGQLLEVHQPVHPAPGRAVPDRVLARQAELSLQELPASGCVHQPRRVNFVARKRDAVRARFGQVCFQSFGPAEEMEAGILAAYFEKVGFEEVAIELKRGQIRAQADEALAVIFEAAVLQILRLPLEAQVVLQIMFGEQVLFEI